MRSLLIGTILTSSILVISESMSAQVGPPSERAQEIQRRREELDLQRRMNDMRTLEQRLRLATRRDQAVPSEPKLSSEARQRILNLRRVDQADSGRYDDFLRQARTGILKLFPDLGCISKNVVRVSKDCESFVPLSSSFTFRTNSYSDEMYHDIHFEDGRLFSKSFFSQGIITVVGNERIEDIDLSHPAAFFLTTFQPATSWKQASEHAKQFQSGIDSGGRFFADNVIPHQETTYLMRMIAYRLENGLAPLSEETTLTEMMFHSLAYDKRLDVIVAFRVLRVHEEGAITIVWKELHRKDAPKVNIEKKQRLRDFRPI